MAAADYAGLVPDGVAHAGVVVVQDYCHIAKVAVRNQEKTKVVWVKTIPPVGVSRQWFPVYWPAHRDPELGEVGARPHFHIAWNRFTAAQQRRLARQYGQHGDRQLAGIVLYEENARWWVDKRRGTPIVGPPVVPRLSVEWMKRVWKELR